jgi:hypothetical protein
VSLQVQERADELIEKQPGNQNGVSVRPRERADTRTEAQRWLGDPPPDRSALAQRKLMS